MKEQSPAESQYENLSTKEWLNSRHALFDKVISLSKRWLDTVNPNPLKLRQHGIKGKKKLVELFDAYLAIYPFLPMAEQKSIDERLKDILAITYKPQYHNMAYVDDKQFREDATSYLRLCYLMKKKGFDTTLYRQEIKKVLGRLNEHMPTRGPNQQMTFSRYYEYLGFKEPFPLAKAYDKGIIARRVEPNIMNRVDVYMLTHEIFAAYRFGDEPEAGFFSEDDKTYLGDTLKKLIDLYIEKDDPDLAAELTSCMRLLKMQEEPIFKTAVNYLLSRQNSDGSFGDYEWLRSFYGEYVKEGNYLHTTLVVLKALSLTFGNIEIRHKGRKAF